MTYQYSFCSSVSKLFFFLDNSIENNLTFLQFILKLLLCIKNEFNKGCLHPALYQLLLLLHRRSKRCTINK